jgi:hypothetical protein
MEAECEKPGGWTSTAGGDDRLGAGARRGGSRGKRPAGADRLRLAIVAVIYGLGSLAGSTGAEALAALGIGVLTGCAREATAPAEGKDAVLALEAPVESRRYDLEFWAREERGRTGTWMRAARYCCGRREAAFPNCRTVRMAAWWGTPPPIPPLPQVAGMPGVPRGGSEAQQANSGSETGGGKVAAGRPGPGSSGGGDDGRRP